LMPGSDGIVRTLAEAKTAARKVGYPLLIKAAAGGGGRGMRVARDENELTRQLPMAQSEAESAFGNGDVYIERYLENPRHVEVQILADNFGHVYAVGDRDCSLQRRHQKIVEEAPAPFLNKRVRDNLMKAAAKGAKAAGYRSAGTLEFLVDKEGHFYFMEMNTRIQVEHPITELVSNIDLVTWQLRIAMGEQLKIDERDLETKGHALECRITCEDPFRDFAASVGTVTTWVAPGGPGVRVDSHLYSGYAIPPYYDSLLAKIVTWGKDRNEAIDRMQRALRETIVDGVATITPLHQLIMADPGFRKGEVHTGFVADFMDRHADLLQPEALDTGE
ncbi:MAG TPA: ATP-grasp domain-containing protein, partial [Thermomicrobiales bacterium]|nr:ATP-grasp domain-containing protein [Thermomicrobiales bacterium]